MAASWESSPDPPIQVAHKTVDPSPEIFATPISFPALRVGLYRPVKALANAPGSVCISWEERSAKTANHPDVFATNAAPLPPSGFQSREE